jgi:hypothetical protein
MSSRQQLERHPRSEQVPMTTPTLPINQILQGGCVEILGSLPENWDYHGPHTGERHALDRLRELVRAEGQRRKELP